MKCDRCYFENPSDKTHCINCGKKLPPKPPKKETKPTEGQKPVATYVAIKKSPVNNIKEHEENDYYQVHYKETSTDNDSSSLKYLIIWIFVLIIMLLVAAAMLYK